MWSSDGRHELSDLLADPGWKEGCHPHVAGRGQQPIEGAGVRELILVRSGNPRPLGVVRV